MATLSDEKILECILLGEMEIVPFVQEHIQPSSIDLTLDVHYSTLKDVDCIDTSSDNSDNYDKHTIDGELILQPNDFIIGRIAEKLTMPKDCTGHIYSRNSLIRLGIDVSLSGYINPGYSGRLPIVIKNMGNAPVRLIPNMRICQLELVRTETQPLKDYSERADAKYLNEDDFVSLIHHDVEFLEFKSKNNDKSGLASFLKDRIQEKSRAYIDGLTDEQKRRVGLK